MNPETAEPPPFAEPPAESWGWKKFFLIVLLAFAAHLAFVFLLGAKKTAPPRAVKNVPIFHLADNASELVRLTDPTLFALPHAEDFSAEVMAVTPAGITAEFRWTEAPPFLGLNPASLGGDFSAFMQTNRVAASALKLKPEPQLAVPASNIEPILPQNSAWSLAGGLAARRVLNNISVPPQAVNDVLAPSRVQLLVAPDGNVVSAVLLESSGLDATDQSALTLARTLRFAPANQVAFGEILFTWHTVPVTAP
jgi:TonB family protein